MIRIAMKKILIFFFLLIATSSWAYTPPIGIPDPGTWGAVHPIDSSAPAQPDPWTEDQAGFYYIDSTSGSCSDAGRGNLSVPRCTPPTDVSEDDGSRTIRILFAAASVHTTQWTITSFAGTAAYPIWIGAASADAKVHFTPGGATSNAIIVSDSSYLYFENIHVTGTNIGDGYSALRIIQSSNHIVFRNSDVTDFPIMSKMSPISMDFTSSYEEGDVINYVVFYNLTLSKLGLSNWPPNVGAGDGERIAIKVQDGTDHVWVLSSSFDMIGEDGVQLLWSTNRGPNAGVPSYVYIGGNTFYRCQEQAIDVKHSNDVIISSNTIHLIRVSALEGWEMPDGGGAGEGIVINDDGEGETPDISAHNTWVIFNKIYDVVRGISVESGRASYIVGNLIYDLYDYADEGAYISYGIRGYKSCTVGDTTCVLYVVNNTVAGIVDYGCRTQTTTYDNYFANNIWYSTTAPTLYHLRVQTTTNVEDVRNELVYDPVTEKVSDYTCVSGCITHQDPKFTNYATRDFTLQSDSPAIDAGYDHTVYDTFNSLYSISIEKDINGTARPINTLWDIGAYEYGSGGSGPWVVTVANGTEGALTGSDASLLGDRPVADGDSLVVTCTVRNGWKAKAPTNTCNAATESPTGTWTITPTANCAFTCGVAVQYLFN
jgi:hypothetical protein